MPNNCACHLEKPCQILLHCDVLISIIIHTKKYSYIRNMLQLGTCWELIYTLKEHSLVQFVYNTEVI